MSERIDIEKLSPGELKFIQEVQAEAAKDAENKKESTDDVKDESTELTEEDLELEKALKTGFNPNYTGKGKVDAFTWNKVGNMIRDKQEAVKDIKALKGAVQELVETNRRLDQKFQKAEEIAYIRARDEFQTRKIQAIKNGDIAEVDRIEKEASQTLQRPVEAPKGPRQPTQEQLDWAESQKDWLNPENPDLLEAAKGAEMLIRQVNKRKGITMTDTELLNEVAENVKALPLFKDKFVRSGVQKQKEARVGAVETPSRGSSGSKTKYTTLDDLPFEHKVQFKAVRLADPNITVEEYVKIFDTAQKRNQR